MKEWRQLTARLRRARIRRRERRMLRLSPRAFCRRLRLVGWEHLHECAPLFLLSPNASPRVVERTLDLYHQGAERAVLFPVSARKATAKTFDEAVLELEHSGQPVRCFSRPAGRALELDLPAVWALGRPDGPRRFLVRFSPAVSPRPNDTVETLTQRYLDLLEAES